MRRVISILSVVVIAAAVSLAVADEEKTIKGEAQCARCLKKEAPECQVLIETKEGDKTVTYHLVSNEESKKLKGKVCEEKKKVSATGTVAEKEGKLQFTAKKIEIET